MMRLLLDENLSSKLAKLLPGRDVFSVAAMGWQSLSNGRLLAAAEAEEFQLMLTADTNMAYQQSMAGRTLGIIVLPTNRIPLLAAMQGALLAAIAACQPSQFLVVDPQANG
jgi:predicted nuclease of predicted toxin-antitoxin system